MSRYYDPVTHRFVNADGYFQSGGSILDANMSPYCRNNPIMFVDPTGTKCEIHDPYYVPNCFTCNPEYLKFSQDRIQWHNKVTGDNYIGLTDDGYYYTADDVFYALNESLHLSVGAGYGIGIQKQIVEYVNFESYLRLNFVQLDFTPNGDFNAGTGCSIGGVYLYYPGITIFII